jgi:hypothetical protein
VARMAENGNLFAIFGVIWIAFAAGPRAELVR